MKNITHSMRRLVAIAIVAGATMASPAITNAAPPVVATDDGAFVRILGNPTDGTIKFQYGWSKDTPASDAAGYWVGVYDVTNSKYVWVTDTGPTDLPEQFSRNALPTADLTNGDYKVVFFVRGSYAEPVTNIAEIDGVPFTVNYMGG
jgi:hypothetical protein